MMINDKANIPQKRSESRGSTGEKGEEGLAERCTAKAKVREWAGIYEATIPEERASQCHPSYPKGSHGGVSDGEHDQGIEPKNSHDEAPTQSEMSKEQ